jgi:putative transposase
MTDVMPEQQAVDLDELGDESAGTDGLDAVDEQLIARLAGRARAGGLALTGEGGLLTQLTKRLVESALEGEITDHLGYDRHDAAGRDGGNSRNGHRTKTVLTEVGPVEIDVPRDRDGVFEPKIVAKRQRRLSGVDELVISLSAKGLTTGEVQAHLAEVYGANVSRQTISTITDKVVEGMAEWGEPAPRPGLPGDLHRCDQRQDPRREGRQPPDLCRARGHRGWAPRHPRAVGR